MYQNRDDRVRQPWSDLGVQRKWKESCRAIDKLRYPSKNVKSEKFWKVKGGQREEKGRRNEVTGIKNISKVALNMKRTLAPNSGLLTRCELFISFRQTLTNDCSFWSSCLKFLGLRIM
jgi:hypothetical protein